MGNLRTLLPSEGLSMFMRRSRFMSISLLGVKLPPARPPLLGVMLNDVPVSCADGSKHA